MLPAANRGAGANICAPDVCTTVSGSPAPFVNVGAHAMAVPFSPVVFVCMMNALNLVSEIPATTGDEPGVLGPGPKLAGAFVAGNPIVNVDGLPAINLTCPATGNAGNAVGASLVPDAVNVFYCRAGLLPAGGRALSAEDLSALRAALDGAPPRGAMLDDGIALLRIAAFTADVSTRVYNEIRRLTAAGMRLLLFDLRDNPGGDLGAAIRLAGDFLPAGTVVATTTDTDGDETVHWSHAEQPYEMPLGVLVDRGTASAAELFAGCLKAHGRALVVGERTYGKGSVQRILPGRDAPGAAYATVATFTLPNGDPIEGLGVHPHVALAWSNDP
jgi:carboxyl-terminal processing protease